MKSWFRSMQPFALAAALAVVLGACDEKLDTGLACPALCPHQQVPLQDETFFPVELDTSITGFPSLGDETELFVASMGDTLQTMAIVRYDSLPQSFRHNAAAEDSLIYFVDSAVVKLFITTGDTLGPPTTIEIYDVDMGGPDDTDPTAVRTAFTPDRLIGSRTVPADSMRDTTVVPIDAGVVLAKIQAAQTASPGNRLRIGIKVNSTGGASHVRVLSSETVGAAPILRFRPNTDTAVAKITVEPKSTVPDNPFLRITMKDYLLVHTGPPAPPADVLRVGSLPARRVYLRFNIPARIIDSSNVVRATLVLTQRPVPDAPQPTDTVVIQEFRVAAAPAVTDLARALLFVQRFRDLDTLGLVAAGSGEREFEVINLIRGWRGTTAEKTPRTMALASQSEGVLPRLVDFYSNEAAGDLRPRLRITYMPQAGGGLP